jgi:hypothetical protein
MEKQDNMALPKVPNSLIIESKDIPVVEMPGKEVKSLVLKMINHIKEDSNKQMNVVEKNVVLSIQDLDKKFSNLDRNSAKIYS